MSTLTPLPMKKVALVNGVARQFKYNKVLAQKYAEIGYVVNEIEFSKVHMFSHHQRHKLLPQVQDILTNHDVIHCQSGGYFPIIHHFIDQNHGHPFIFETPVIKSTTGTFFAGAGLSKSYKVKDNALIQKFLDSFCFTPHWKDGTLSKMATLKQRGQGLVLASRADLVSDIEGEEDKFNHVFEKGAHGRLFYENDFGIIKQFLEDFKRK